MTIATKLFRQSLKWFTPDGLTEQAFFERWRLELQSAYKRHAEYMRERRNKDPERARLMAREWYHRDPEKRRAEARKHRMNMKSDPERIRRYRLYCLEKTKKRLKEDPNFRLRFRIRGRIHMALKRDKCPKSEGTEALIGCSMDFFRKYIEARWLPGMNWSNYGRGGWHLDHVVPCKHFDLTDSKQRAKCFHYTNVQPLWQSDNLSKGCKRQIQQELFARERKA